MRYYIFETQHKQDGVINVVATESRSNFTGGLSYFHERVSKMVASEQFTSVAILLTDENLNPVPNGQAYIHDGVLDIS